MNLTQTAALLTLCARYDQRTIGEQDVHAWHDVLADLDPDDAADAVKAWYRDHRERVMPADIRANVKARRADRRDRRNAIEPPTADPDQPGPYRDEFHANVIRLGDRHDIRHALNGPPAGRGCPPELRDPQAAGRVAALAITCPHCHAVPGALCVIPATGKPLAAGVHPGRIDAAQPATA